MNKWFISDTHFSHNNIIRYTELYVENIGRLQMLGYWISEAVSDQ